MSDQEPNEGQAKAIATTIERVRLAAVDHDRHDLAERLLGARQRLAQPGVRVLVVGEFKQGKSSLINQILGTTVCPVDDDIATAVLTHVEFSEDAWGKAYRATEGDGPPDVEPIDQRDAPVYVSELGNPQNEKKLLRVEFGMPANVLRSGMILIDTPGVGGLESSHGIITIGALAQADAVIFVSDASQEITEPELAFLKHAHELCPTVMHVFSKIDLYPEWRRVVELSEGHLRNAGLAGPVQAISSTVHQHARRTRDDILAEESGYPQLTQLLRSQVLEPGEKVVARAALADTVSSLEQLLAPLESERASLDDPDKGAQLLAEYQAAQETAEQLQTQAARWQITLNDGIGELNATIDHDLRARTRQLISEGESVIDTGDPADFWEEFQPEMYAKMTEGIVENFALLTAEVSTLVDRVERHFAVAQNELNASFEFAAPITHLEVLEIDDTNVNLDTQSAVAKGFSGLKGGYSGVLMLTFGGGMIGLGAVVLAPLGIAAGVLMGRKTVRDEQERALLTRRQQAKQALRKYVDEISFQVGKESRDALRQTQQTLRDTFTDRAVELSRSTKEAVTATQAALKTDGAERIERHKEVVASIEQLNVLLEQCRGFEAEVQT